MLDPVVPVVLLPTEVLPPDDVLPNGRCTTSMLATVALGAAAADAPLPAWLWLLPVSAMLPLLLALPAPMLLPMLLPVPAAVLPILPVLPVLPGTSLLAVPLLEPVPLLAMLLPALSPLPVLPVLVLPIAALLSMPLPLLPVELHAASPSASKAASSTLFS